MAGCAQRVTFKVRQITKAVKLPNPIIRSFLKISVVSFNPPNVRGVICIVSLRMP